jgi:hypothetical protein
MAIHDVPDVFLEAGKCMNYIGKAKGGKWLGPYTDVMFGESVSPVHVHVLCVVQGRDVCPRVDELWVCLLCCAVFCMLRVYIVQICIMFV